MITLSSKLFVCIIPRLWLSFKLLVALFYITIISAGTVHSANKLVLDQAIDQFWSNKNYAYWMIVASQSLRGPCRLEFDEYTANLILGGIESRLVWDIDEANKNRNVAEKQSKLLWENEGEVACIVVRKWMYTLPESVKSYLKWNN